MADYQDIRGLRVKYLSADPGDPASGEVWYNSTTGTLRSLLVSEAWASGAPLIQTRGQITMFGSQTSSVAAGGSGPGATMYNDTEEYNGSGWSVGGDLNTTREGSHGAGVLTAGVIVGGFIEPTTYSNAAEEYDGSTWTSVTVAPYAVNNTAAFGTQTASVFAGGDPGSKNTSLEYGGSGSWTAGGTLTTGRAQSGGAGLAPLSAGLIWGGTPLSTATETYDGTSWTAGNVLPAGVQFGGGAGTQTAALSFGNFSGPTTITTATTKFDGTSWTAAPALGSSQARSQGSGSQALALVAGGDYPHTTPVATTQEFNQSTNVITAGTWASTGSMTQPGSGKSATGTQTAGLAWGGYVTSNTQTQVTELYDGTSWTPGGSLPNQNGQGGIVGASGFGTQTAAVSAGGWSQGPADYYYTTCWKYNGTSWSATGAISPGRARVGPGAGTETAGLTQGGVNPGNSPPNIYLTNTDHFDGSTWTAGGVLPDGRAYAGICGTDTAALQMGGYNNPPSLSYSTSFDYNGSSWTAAGTMLAPGYGGSHMGGAAANASLVVGGPPGQNTNLSQSYNGTNWHTMPSVTTARTDGSCGLGTQTAALAIGNAPAPASVVCEEFTGETSAVNIETLTTS